MLFEQIQIGKVVIIYAVKSTPCDKKVMQGEITLDQYMLTGESTPQGKRMGYCFCNTLLVSRNFHIPVLKAGKDTGSREFLIETELLINK